jgi:hypothetical protein
MAEEEEEVPPSYSDTMLGHPSGRRKFTADAVIRWRGRVEEHLLAQDPPAQASAAWKLSKLGIYILRAEHLFHAWARHKNGFTAAGVEVSTVLFKENQHTSIIFNEPEDDTIIVMDGWDHFDEDNLDQLEVWTELESTRELQAAIAGIMNLHLAGTEARQDAFHPVKVADRLSRLVEMALLFMVFA